MRLMRAGVGVLCDKKQGVAASIQQVLNNWTSMKENLSRVNHELKCMGGASKAVSIMEQVSERSYTEDVALLKRLPWWPFSLAAVSAGVLIAIF